MPSASGKLTILPTTKPFKSSYLALPPSPFSPKFPIYRPSSPPFKPFRPLTDYNFDFPSPPQEPLGWLWKCHKCHRVYRLAVTRRCLDDGHYFCAGTTTTKRSRRAGGKKVVRHQACASEFDYAGWKAWATWRRVLMEQVEAARTLEGFLDFGDGHDVVMGGDSVVPRLPARDEHKDCWNSCDYPSECRWGKTYGVATPVISSTATVPTLQITPPSTTAMDMVPEESTQTSFDDILFDMSSFPCEDSGESIVDPGSSTTPTEDKKPSMDDLLASVNRRKRRSVGATPSPLASNPPSPVAQAVDDFELDHRSSIERVGEAVGSLFGVRSKSTGRRDKKRGATGVW